MIIIKLILKDIWKITKKFSNYICKNRKKNITLIVIRISIAIAILVILYSYKCIIISCFPAIIVPYLDVYFLHIMFITFLLFLYLNAFVYFGTKLSPIVVTWFSLRLPLILFAKCFETYLLCILGYLFIPSLIVIINKSYDGKVATLKDCLIATTMTLILCTMWNIVLYYAINETPYMISWILSSFCVDLWSEKGLSYCNASGYTSLKSVMHKNITNITSCSNKITYNVKLIMANENNKINLCINKISDICMDMSITKSIAMLPNINKDYIDPVYAYFIENIPSYISYNYHSYRLKTCEFCYLIETYIHYMKSPDIITSMLPGNVQSNSQPGPSSGQYYTSQYEYVEYTSNELELAAPGPDISHTLEGVYDKEQRGLLITPEWLLPTSDNSDKVFKGKTYSWLMKGFLLNQLDLFIDKKYEFMLRNHLSPRDNPHINLEIHEDIANTFVLARTTAINSTPIVYTNIEGFTESIEKRISIVRGVINDAKMSKYIPVVTLSMIGLDNNLPALICLYHYYGNTLAGKSILSYHFRNLGGNTPIGPTVAKDNKSLDYHEFRFKKSIINSRDWDNIVAYSKDALFFPVPVNYDYIPDVGVIGFSCAELGTRRLIKGNLSALYVPRQKLTSLNDFKSDSYNGIILRELQMARMKKDFSILIAMDSLLKRVNQQLDGCAIWVLDAKAHREWCLYVPKGYESIVILEHKRNGALDGRIILGDVDRLRTEKIIFPRPPSDIIRLAKWGNKGNAFTEKDALLG